MVKLTRQTKGRVVFEGQDVSDLWSQKSLRDYRRRVQLIFQDPYETLNPKQTIHDFVIEPLEVNGIGTAGEREAKVISALEAAGLRPGTDFAFRFPHELSGGQRQRVVIAGALVMDPEVIVADEPVSMLDVSIRTELLRLMLDLRKERGLTYLFITHDLSLAWVIADRIAVMYLGKIMEIGPAERVIRDPRNPYTKALVSVSPSPDPPDAGERAQRTILAGRDPRRGAHPDRLPVPPALPARLRSLPRRGAAAVRRRRRAVRGLLAGRGRPALARPSQAEPGRPDRGRHGGPCDDRERDGRRRGGSGMTDAADAPVLEALPPTAIADLLAASSATIVAELEALGTAVAGDRRPASGARTSASAT